MPLSFGATIVESSSLCHAERSEASIQFIAVCWILRWILHFVQNDTFGHYKLDTTLLLTDFLEASVRFINLQEAYLFKDMEPQGIRRNKLLIQQNQYES